ncbi:hypothetical protein P4U07_28510 [Bacillus mycoides]|uniref:hypothetical protein n=1 Tax=Bacillus mycoides TaxID=1405 RepID=UPI002E24EEE5|nr:hypothetical protein [Bacillus mycoides]
MIPIKEMIREEFKPNNNNKIPKINLPKNTLKEEFTEETLFKGLENLFCPTGINPRIVLGYTIIIIIPSVSSLAFSQNNKILGDNSTSIIPLL